LTMVKNELLSNPLYTNNIVSPDLKTTAIIVNLVYDKKYYELLDRRNELRKLSRQENFSQLDHQRYILAKEKFDQYRDSIRDVQHENIRNIRKIMEGHKKNAELFLGGVNMIADDLVTFVKNDLKTYGVIVLILLIVTLWILFGNIRWVVLPVLTLAISITASVGFLGLFGFEITVISSNYISLQLILTTSIIIHLIVKYRELAFKFPSKKQKDLVLHSVLSMSKPTLFAVITTIAGFTSLILSGILPVINLGWMMSAGLIISFIISYILFPSVLVLMEPEIKKNKTIKQFSITIIFANIVRNHEKLIYLGTIIIVLFSVYGVTQLRVENSFISYFKTSTEIYKGMAVIDRQLGGTTPLDITIDFPQNKNKVIENASDVSNENDEFFDEFEEEFKQSEHENQYWFTSDKMQKIQAIHDYLETVPELGKVISFGTMLEVGRTLNKGKELDNFELALLYNELPERFSQLIIKPYLNIENDQARFYARIVDSDPTLRRDALLKKIKLDLNENIGIDSKNIHLSGIMVLYNNMLQSLFDSQILTLGAMILVLFVIFWALFGSLKISFIAMIANLIPVSVVFGLMGVLDIPLDMMTITIASISIGIAVDDTIHYLHRFKKEFRIVCNYSEALMRSHLSIGYAMSYTSIAIAIGFFVLVLSPFIPTIYFGLLTVVAMLMALVADLLLLPKLIIAFRVFGEEKNNL
ncbi:RND family transporter, partial [Campylobacterota bacterium]